MPEILIIDDDAHIRTIVEYTLKKAGFGVRCAVNGQVGLDAIAASRPDLVVLDILMPELDGLEVCRRIRAAGNLPVILLTSVNDEVDRIIGLELGADDYVAKPFSPRELLARIRTVLRRCAPSSQGSAENSPPLTVGSLVVDSDRMIVSVDQQNVSLTASEFSLLRTLATRPTKVFTRFELMDRIYEGTAVVADRTIDSHIKRVRRKFEPVGIDPIETVHGAGYRLGRF